MTSAFCRVLITLPAAASRRQHAPHQQHHAANDRNAACIANSVRKVLLIFACICGGTTHPMIASPPAAAQLGAQFLERYSCLTTVRFCVNLSRFLLSRLRCTSAMSLSRHADRCAWRSAGWLAMIWLRRSL